LAIRISYVGELGWELYIPSDYAAGALDDLLDVGREFDLAPVGMHAMNFLRLEKAYRHWSHDISPDDTQLEAGLGFVCAFDKNVPFIGRDAVLAQKREGKLKRRLAQFLLQEPEPQLYHNEPIMRDGRQVGYLTSGGYGFSLGGAIGMGYVRHDAGVDQAWLDAGKFEILVAGRRIPTRASLKPFWDPKGERMKA
jgi:4-methylaminobutanoate oxidase (formaldehyde-forming)